MSNLGTPNKVAVDLSFLWNDAIPEAPATYEIDFDFLLQNRDEIIRLLQQLDASSIPSGRIFR